MSTWDHVVRPMTAEEQEGVDRHHGKAASWAPSGVRTCHHGSRGCAAKATHVGSYRYVTGRGGRETTRKFSLCGEHAAAFAKKHEIFVPSAGFLSEASGATVVLPDGRAVPAVACDCGDGSCSECDDRGMRPRDGES